MKLSYFKICKNEQCQKEYITSRINQQYCCNSCRRKEILRICPTCKKEFILPPSLVKKQNFCSYSCKRVPDDVKLQISTKIKKLHHDANGPYNEFWKQSISKAMQQLVNDSNYVNPMFGKSRNDIWIKKYGEEIGKIMIDDYRRRCKEWSIFKEGRTLEERFGYEFASRLKKKLSDIRKKDISNLSEVQIQKRQYYYEVLQITSKQPISNLENFHLRGKSSRKENAHHLDHIIPIIYGFENNIPPEIIGNIQNLRFIPSLENYKKSRKYED